MKYLITLSLILVTSLVSSQEKLLKGFGSLQLGMTVQEVNRIVHPKISIENEPNTHYTLVREFVRITKDLILSDVHLIFLNNKLIFVKSDYSEHLHNGLSKIYGVSQKYGTSNGTLIRYRTNSSTITCISLYPKEMVIFNNEINYGLLFNRLYPAINELNKIQSFDGL
ncbi:hypothetical protein JRG66_05555 [Salinimicrobium tongyeongense]|uniref:Uncharacterized protein n=1 Tax=Salinimicrobium tongyeongense TaxID=2809707 RepID=A0ABY6NTT4_9FLAO|nr:hypothetical protein [Salinimicrobium tongyeongense]UZH56330.1 hypothetical protein JRG66_05555 [Salinimicrobium tongyeongense]